MAVPYIVIEQENPGNRNEMIYFARTISDGTIDIDELIRQLEKMSTLSGADIQAVIYGLVKLASHHLSNGKIVELGALGTFRITINSEGRPSEEEVDEDSIRRARVTYRPGKLIRRMLKRITFIRK